MDELTQDAAKRHEVTADAELYANAMAGGPDAFGPIVDRYKDAVFGIALARVRDFHAAEDVAQAVLIAAFERLGSLRQPSRLGAWLRSMAIHQSIDYVRRRQPILDGGNVPPAAGRDDEPDVRAERRELREQVLTAINRLGSAQQETTTLFYINGYSMAEVAAIQEVPVGTVKGRLHDARKKLRVEMTTMVEQVLKSEAPKEDFGQHVLAVLARSVSPQLDDRMRWEELCAELRRVGPRGIEGYVRALESPHSPVRKAAVRMSPFSDSADTRETIVRLMKAGLKDRNNRVRRSAVDVLLSVDAAPDRRREEFVPLVIPLLWDVSRRVRKRAAYALGWHPDEVPLEPVVRALLDEDDSKVRPWKADLVRAVLDAR
jgi:RNA polymerase sigma-70 factor (ECF subfamily)